MRKSRAVAAVVVVALVLVAGAVAIAVATFDVATFTGPLAAQVERATGRKLFIGSTDVALSLEPRLRLRDVRLANAPGARVPEMASVRELEVQVRLVPLLSRRIDIVRITLVEPRIGLEIDATGRGNWQLDPRREEGRSTGSGDAPGSGFTLGVGELRVERGVIDYRDARTGETTTAAIERLLLRARAPDDPLQIEVAGSVGRVPLTLDARIATVAEVLQRRDPLAVAIKGQVAGRTIDARAQVSRQGDAIELRALALASGDSRVEGSLSWAPAGNGHRVRFALTSPQLRLADLAFAAPVTNPAPSASTARAAPQAAAPDRRLFPATPVSFEPLRAHDLQGTIAIGKLVLPDGGSLDALDARVASTRGRLELSPLRASAYGGVLDGRIVVDASAGREPSLEVAVKGRDLDLGRVLDAIGLAGEVRNGKTTLDVSLAMHGASPREWAADARGQLRIDVGAATILRAGRSLPPLLVQILNATNPYAARDGFTELRCAVIRMPIAQGVARFDRTVGLETSRLGLLASGTVDLRNETLDVALRPRSRDLGGVALSELAGFVKVSGPIVRPTLAIDAAGSVAGIARIGAALGTAGGTAVLGGLLQAQGAGDECAVAAGRAAPAAPATSTATAPAGRAASAIEDIARALQSMRRRDGR